MKKWFNRETVATAVIGLVAIAVVGFFIMMYIDISSAARSLRPTAHSIGGIPLNCRTPPTIEIAQYCSALEANIISSANKLPPVLSMILGLFGLLVAAWAAKAASDAAKVSKEAVDDAIEVRKISERSAAAAELLASTNEKTAQRQLRAYVGPSNNTMSKILPGEDVHGVVEFCNFGNTPAHNFRNGARFGLIAPNASFREIDIEESMEIGPATSLPPQGKAYAEKIFGRALTAQEVRSVMDGEVFLLLRGRVEYLDVFGEHQQFDYCYYYEPNTQHLNHSALWHEGNQSS